MYATPLLIPHLTQNRCKFEKHHQTASTFLVITPADFEQSSTRTVNSAKHRAAVAERTASVRHLETAEIVADACERRLGLDERWTEDNPEYSATLEYMNRGAFVRTISELQGLIVAKLFELSKANLADTGALNSSFN